MTKIANFEREFAKKIHGVLEEDSKESMFSAIFGLDQAKIPDRMQSSIEAWGALLGHVEKSAETMRMHADDVMIKFVTPLTELQERHDADRKLWVEKLLFHRQIYETKANTCTRCFYNAQSCINQAQSAKESDLELKSANKTLEKKAPAHNRTATMMGTLKGFGSAIQKQATATALKVFTPEYYKVEAINAAHIYQASINEANQASREYWKTELPQILAVQQLQEFTRVQRVDEIFRSLSESIQARDRALQEYSVETAVVMSGIEAEKDLSDFISRTLEQSTVPHAPFTYNLLVSAADIMAGKFKSSPDSSFGVPLEELMNRQRISNPDLNIPLLLSQLNAILH